MQFTAKLQTLRLSNKHSKGKIVTIRKKGAHRGLKAQFYKKKTNLKYFYN